MRPRVVPYAGAALVLLLFLLGVLRLLLEPEAWRGVAVAAAVVYPIQVVAFGLLSVYREDWTKFLVVWLGGPFIRMFVIVIMGLLLSRREWLPPVPTLVALAVFFVALLILEPVFFRSDAEEA